MVTRLREKKGSLMSKKRGNFPLESDEGERERDVCLSKETVWTYYSSESSRHLPKRYLDMRRVQLFKH